MIDWGTLVAGFVLGTISSCIGAFMQAVASSFSERRNHQFARMLKTTDEVRHDVESAVQIALDYWMRDGGDGTCKELEGRMTGLEYKILGTLTLLRRLDEQRFSKLESLCVEDFMDALTGGQFQVCGRPADAAAGARVQRFGQRLINKISECSCSPSARSWSLGRK